MIDTDFFFDLSHWEYVIKFEIGSKDIIFDKLSEIE